MLICAPTTGAEVLASRTRPEMLLPTGSVIWASTWGTPAVTVIGLPAVSGAHTAPGQGMFGNATCPWVVEICAKGGFGSVVGGPASKRYVPARTAGKL